MIVAAVVKAGLLVHGIVHVLCVQLFTSLVALLVLRQHLIDGLLVARATDLDSAALLSGDSLRDALGVIWGRSSFPGARQDMAPAGIMAK